MRQELRNSFVLGLLIGIPAYAMFGVFDPPSKSNGTSIEKPSSRPASESPPQPLDHLEARLRQLGATYYRLEAIENRSGYGFVCEVDGAGNPSRPRILRATGARPLDPIHEIVATLEQQ